MVRETIGGDWRDNDSDEEFDTKTEHNIKVGFNKLCWECITTQGTWGFQKLEALKNNKGDKTYFKLIALIGSNCSKEGEYTKNVTWSPPCALLTSKGIPDKCPNKEQFDLVTLTHNI